MSDSLHAIAVQPGERAEIELKLLSSRKGPSKLREVPVIVQHARNRGAFRRLETVYYDTPEQRCSSMACRCACDAAANTSFRRSSFYPISGNLCPTAMGGAGRRRHPDLARLPADEIGDPVKTLTNDALVPVFTTKFRRHARHSICPMRRLKSRSTRG